MNYEIKDKEKSINQVRNIIRELKESKSKDEISNLFCKLNEIQTKLAKYSFKYNEIFSEEVEIFIRDFDRLDDEETREYLLKRIRENKYDI